MLSFLTRNRERRVPLASTNPASLAGIAAVLFMLATTASAAPFLVKDINPSASMGSYPAHMRAVGDTLFFATQRPYALWKTDGTAAGTVQIADVGQMRNPIEFGDLLAFGTFADGLWTSNGTTAGTRLIAPLEFWDTGIDPSSITVHGGGLFVVGRGPGDAWGLWRSDGTPDGTMLVKALEGGAQISTFRGMLVLLSGRAVHTSDGTAEGTRQIIPTGTESEFLRPKELRITGDLALFTSCEYARPCQLWRTDGTDEGTFAIATLIERYDDENASDSFNPTVLPSATGNGPFLVCAQGELWSSDGTVDGTQRLGSSPCNGNMASRNMAELNGARIFGSGGVLWRSDGTPEGTAPLVDIQPRPMDIQVLGHTSAVALFAVSTAEGETELWRTDGTPAGSVAVSPMPIVGLFHYDDSNIVVERPVVATLGETIFFSGCTPDLGCELWAVTISSPSTTTTTSSSTSTSTSTTTTNSTMVLEPTTSTTTNEVPVPTTSTTLTCSSDAVALCDDADPCTVDLCDAGRCHYELRPGLAGVRCRLRHHAPSLACEDGMPNRLEHRLDRARGFVKRAADASDQRKARRRIRRAERQLEAAVRMVARSAQDGMGPACADALERAIEEARAGMNGWLARNRGP